MFSDCVRLFSRRSRSVRADVWLPRFKSLMFTRKFSILMLLQTKWTMFTQLYQQLHLLFLIYAALFVKSFSLVWHNYMTMEPIHSYMTDVENIIISLGTVWSSTIFYTLMFHSYAAVDFYVVSTCSVDKLPIPWNAQHPFLG